VSKSGQDKNTVGQPTYHANSDPLPFQFWHRHASITQDAIFVDVDYPPLIGRKRDRILTDDVLRDALLQTNMHPAQPPIYIRSDRYLALGCDLRDLTALERLLKSEINAACSSFLFVAEVSVTYMPTSEADALIRWASSFTHGAYTDLNKFAPAPDSMQLASACWSSTYPRAHVTLLHKLC